jgi:hypothetical protein
MQFIRAKAQAAGGEAFDAERSGRLLRGWWTVGQRTIPEARQHHGPRPVVVLLKHSVWLSLVNQPLFVLYDDGCAIFPAERESGVPITYRTARIDLRSMDSALAHLGMGPDFFWLKRRYDFRPSVTDQETVFLYVWRGDSLTRVAVRAGLVSEDSLADGVPVAFRAAFQRLNTFHSAHAEPWHPASVNVDVWAYEYAPDSPPLDWPAEWPDLKSPDSERRADPYVGEVRTIHVPYKYLTELQRLLENRREKQAIRINGRKWAVGYRVPFPGQQRWRQYFSELEE